MASTPENTKPRFTPVAQEAESVAGQQRFVALEANLKMVKDDEDSTLGFLDRAGAGLSLLCTVHCVVFPLLTLFLPFLGHLTENSTFHWVMAVLIVPLGLYAFARGFRLHHKKWIITLGVFGMALLVLGLLLPDGSAHGTFVQNLGHHNHNGIFNQEAVLTLSGSIFLAIAHIANLRGTHRDHANAKGHRHGHCDGNC